MKAFLKHTLALGLLAAAATASQAQTPARGFSLEGAVIDSRNGNSLGVVNERGDLATLFRAQKAMTFGILRAAGVSLDQLSPEVRARIERFQTTNVEAFRAFSQGLDLKDEGRFAEARESFKRAAELDPSFGLAAEQQQSMPDITISTTLQMRAVMQAAAGAAVDRGKATYVVDLSRAIAALQAGQTVVAVPSAAETARKEAQDYTSNPAGSTSNNLPVQVVALAYGIDQDTSTPRNLAGSSEWRGSEVRTSAGQLELIRTTTGGILANRGGASTAPSQQALLPDGTTAYWGRWNSTPGASATVRVSGDDKVAPSLGQVDFVYGDATRTMPTVATGTFTPTGGSLANVSGTIGVDFSSRQVTLQNLGFQANGLAFSGLNGSASYAAGAGAGGFQGNYTSGACSGCTAFNPLASVFNGNFIGRNANGLVFSTILLTGGGGTASGVHLFTRP